MDKNKGYFAEKPVRYLVVTIFDQEGLFYHEPLEHVPEGGYRYHLSNIEDIIDYPDGISDVWENDHNYFGSILLREPLKDDYFSKDLQFAYLTDDIGYPLCVMIDEFLDEEKFLQIVNEQSEAEYGEDEISRE